LVDAANALEFRDAKLDLVGPNPPTNLAVGVHSDTQVVITFTPPSPEPMDLARYAVFCATPGGGSVTTTTSTAGGAPSGAGGAGGMAFAGVGGVGVGGAGGAGGGAGGMGGSAGMGTAGSTSSPASSTATGATSTGSGTSESCSDVDLSGISLTPGELPDTGLTECGSADATDNIVVDANPNQDMVFAIAAVDNVDNYGPLSSLVCGKPEPVTDFFEAYREAGGAAGGGLCNCTLVGHDAARPFALVALALGALAFGVRRRGGAR
jgi:MYXO-CTERM domain-containing protein